jgi:hypothetical protein
LTATGSASTHLMSQGKDSSILQAGGPCTQWTIGLGNRQVTAAMDKMWNTSAAVQCEQHHAVCSDLGNGNLLNLLPENHSTGVGQGHLDAWDWHFDQLHSPVRAQDLVPFLRGSHSDACRRGNAGCAHCPVLKVSPRGHEGLQEPEDLVVTHPVTQTITHPREVTHAHGSRLSDRRRGCGCGYGYGELRVG